MKEITLKDLYRELEQDPDLRRLGKYKVIFGGGRPIFPIVIEGENIHLGEGDFTEAFTAFDITKAQSLDLGDCKFTDLYLDYLQVGTLKFSCSRASRTYFDFAKVKNCEFGEFTSPEIYFDKAEIEKIFIQNLRSGILHLDDLKVESVMYDGILSEVYRFATDPEGTKSFGDFHEVDDEINERGKTTTQEIHSLTVGQFIEELEENPDLRRLGRYRLVKDGNDDSLSINLELGDKNIYLGEGDFSSLPVSFGRTMVKSMNFGDSTFAELDFGSLTAEKVDLSRSQIGWLNFDLAEIRECFFSKFYGNKINGGHAKIENIFGEEGNIRYVTLDSMTVGQFNINSLQAEELHLGESHIRELYASRGKGIKEMFCEQSHLWLLNLHESKLDELRFEQSSIIKALINKSSIGKVYCDELKAELLYIGRFENELREIDFAEMKGIGHIEIVEILPDSKELASEHKRVFGKLRFGEFEKPEEKEQRHFEGFGQRKVR